MTLKELREKHVGLEMQARAINDELEDKEKNLTDDERRDKERQFDAAVAEADALVRRIERAERVEQFERDDNAAEELRRAVNGGGSGDGEQRTDKPKYTDEQIFGFAMRFGMGAINPEARARVTTMMTPLGEQQRNALPVELRAQGLADTTGGFTVPTGFLPRLIERQAHWGPMMDGAWVERLDTDSGNDLPWPTNDDVANEGGLLADNPANPATELDANFGQRTLGAHVFTSYLVRVSNSLLQDSAFDFASTLERLFARRIGRAANRFLTVGTGANQPTGIVTASGLGHTTTTATGFVADDLIELQHSVDVAYRDAPGVGWMMHDTTFKQVRKLKDGQGNYLLQMGDFRVGAPNTILDKPYRINNAMAAIEASERSMIFGDMKAYITRSVRDFQVARLIERFIDFNQTGFIGFQRLDGNLADVHAVKHMAQAAA